MDLTEWPKSVEIFVSHQVAPAVEEYLNSQVDKMTHPLNISFFPQNGLFGGLLYKVIILARMEVMHGLRNVDFLLPRFIWWLPWWWSTLSMKETNAEALIWHHFQQNLPSPLWTIQQLIFKDIHANSRQGCASPWQHCSVDSQTGLSIVMVFQTIFHPAGNNERSFKGMCPSNSLVLLCTSS